LARILVYTAPARGHLYPVVPTMRELDRRGHSVSLRTISTDVELLRGLGLSAAPVDPAIEAIELEDWQASSPAERGRRLGEALGRRARLAVEDMPRAIEMERPDALLVDVNSNGAAYAAEASGLPWAIYSITASQIPSREAPPFGPGLAPRHGPVGRARDLLVRRLLDATVERRARSDFNPLRERLGLEPFERIADHMLAADRALYFTAEPFEYPRSLWPEGVRLVGPGIWDPPSDQPGWLDEIDRPIVLVTTSTDFQDDGGLIEAALEGLAGEDVHVVATSPGIDPSRFTAPANARVERFVPHRPILDRAVCVVSHGGASITQKAIAAGVPVCAVPFGRDQPEIARRVEVCGAGTRLPGRRLTAQRLREAVLEAIGKSAGARRVAAAFAKAGGAPAAADAVEELLG
jgi:MGT family glycosyltransferase